MNGTIKWGEPPPPQTPGEAIIEAVIRAGAIEGVEVLDDGGCIHIWASNAAEQLEAAIEDLGYTITKK